MPTLHFRGVKVFDGTRFLEGQHDVVVRDRKIDDISAGSLHLEGAFEGAETRDGGALFPGFVDAHVHLSFSDPAEVARRGVTTVLDLGEPMPYARADHPPLRFRFAGPLLTAPGGYPLRSWGANGYGQEVRDVDEAREAVAGLADAGAAMIKVAIEPSEGPLLGFDVMREIVSSSHARGLLVAAHALDNETVSLALGAGVDVLAHTPVGRLDSHVVRECGARGVTVISTLHAFNPRRARRNLYALCAAGCRIAYGTDLGNGPIDPGLNIEELKSIQHITGDVEETLATACSVAGELAGAGGTIAVGAEADLVWVPKYQRLTDLDGAKDVWIGGERVT